MRQAERLRTCLAKLDADLRQYATWIAMRDVDAVRAALGYEQINLWGGSYGTRAALEYLRQFPAHVRSAVLDGAAPPDMMLPASFSIDADAALARVTAACARDVDCAARYPRLAADLDRLLATLGGHAARAITVAHPLTGRRETLPLDRDTFAGLLRPPLYAPQLAALLPYALAEAATDNFAPLIALGTALGGTEDNFFEGMHFAVICAEDVPRLTAAAKERAARTRFGAAFTEMYERICRGVPARPVPAAFYDIPASKVPVLILSGGADPVTPPRYGDAVARKLGNARHLIAEHVGHGVSQQGCAPELVQRFIREAKVDAVDGACLAQLPAPRFFQPIAAP
jgi:pimeloyl-ACP methyl ester carboxylesterase